MSTNDYERLGAFYLGRRYDPETGAVLPETILYDSKDLTTHAVCVGMTGSGKTGLGIGLLEEAAIDGVPAIAIDPKGDLGNLLLTFPELRPGDFEPWIDPGAAARKGRTVTEHARKTAELWRTGLGEWGQPPERIGRFAQSVERVVYTPGSTAGRPLAVLRSFAARAPAVAADDDAMRDRVLASTSGLLALLGINADPIRSREHILIATLLDRAWREGRSLDLASLIREIQDPPVERIGVFDVESFFPSRERFELAMTINNLLASPGFSAWTEGDPLDIGRLLYTPEGRPRLSIISIAHLSEPERMFIVTLLLNELISWMRSQPGSSTLRALLYMDEIFGYFPPVSNPPSKRPMLTLLKQARAYGVGCVLATQNPVDLDYKGLSNAGTWFLGRLQTERDKARVMEGLRGASAAAGADFDAKRIETILSGLGSRVFLMNNVHEDGPVLFHTRWVLSYLAGPLTREQIRRLTPKTQTPAETPPKTPAVATPDAAAPASAGASPATTPNVPAETKRSRPMVPPDVPEAFLPMVRRGRADERILYRPRLVGLATLRYANARAKVDEWKRVAILAGLPDATTPTPWEEAAELAGIPDLSPAPEPGADFAELPPEATNEKSYARWTKMLKTHLYRSRPMRLWKCGALKLTSRPDETEGQFRSRLRDVLREKRDLEMEKLRDKYAPKLASIQEQIRKAEQRVERESAQYKKAKFDAALSVGATVLGALFGRKLGSVGKATTAARGAGRAAQQRGDIGRAEETVEAKQSKLADLERELQEELEEVRDGLQADGMELEELTIAPRKTDLAVDRLVLTWTPWRIDADGIAEPMFAS